MEVIRQSLSHTPIWVYPLFVFLILRGLRSLRPREVTLGALAIIPGLFMIAGLATLASRFAVTASVYGAWLVALAVGAGLGWLLLHRRHIAVDRARGVLLRPADYTILPLILASFAAKYAFGTLSFIHPDLVHQASFGMIQGAIYGFFSGIFVGKFANYTTRYLRETPISSPAVGSGL
jgi:hypothetical protein